MDLAQRTRQDFPILDQMINGHPLIYFDNAATTQKPQCVIDAICEYYQHNNANIHRSVHALGERATEQYEQARAKVQHFIHAKEARECVFVRGTTEAINLVAHSFLLPRLQAGEEILLTELEHHSNIVPWQLICKKTGANLRVLPVNNDGELCVEQLAEKITDNTKFLAIGHVSNAFGTINPLKEIIQMAHERGVLVLVDGAQAAPHVDIDVQDLDCDFYAFSGHKMYAPTGIGVLYAKEALLESMAPYQGGGEMITAVSFEHSEYQKPPYKFEAGTPNIAGAIGLAAAIDYLMTLQLPVIQAYEQELYNYLFESAAQVKALMPVGTAKHKAAIFSFVFAKIHAHDIGTIMNSKGIAIRAGHHCAMPLMSRFELAATARASLSFYNTREEVDRFVQALEQASEVFC